MRMLLIFGSALTLAFSHWSLAVCLGHAPSIHSCRCIDSPRHLRLIISPPNG